jgi:capsular polysaccharide transport system ATP-binding protein
MIICQNVRKSYRTGHTKFEVLKGIDLTINRGDRIAIIGRNGAGKSTLIKQIGGVEVPDSGSIIRRMTNSWPIGFNGGFQGSLTGYDNARFIARIYGTSYAQLREFVENFSELGNSLAMPVKTYSSGMRARLAFALSLAIEFDCYLIDEVILVGDHNFQRKCQTELFEKRADRAMLIASHDMHLISTACNRAVVLHGGLAFHHDDVDQGIAHYEALSAV